MREAAAAEALRGALAHAARADRLRALRSIGCRLARSGPESSCRDRARLLGRIFRALGPDALALGRDVPALARTLLLAGHERDAQAWLLVAVRALSRNRAPAARVNCAVACRMLGQLLADRGELGRGRRWLARAHLLLGRLVRAGGKGRALRLERLRVRECRALWGADRPAPVRFRAMKGVVAAWLREVERRPASARLRRELAGSLVLRAELAIDLRLRAPARRDLEAASRLLLALADAKDQSLRVDHMRAAMALEQGRLLRWDGDIDAARRVWQAALARLTALPQTRRREWLRAQILRRLGVVADRAQDWQASLGHYLEAADALAHVVRAAPLDTSARKEHAGVLREAAGSAAMDGRRTRARELYTRALDAAPATPAHAALRAGILRGLQWVSPTAESAALLGATLGEQATAVLADDLSPLALGEMLAELGRRGEDDDTHALMLGACALADEVCREDSSAGLGELVGAAHTLAQGATSPAQHAEARRWLERAAARAEAATESALRSGDCDDLEVVDDALAHLARHHAEQHRPVEALEVSGRALGLVRAAHACDPAAHESMLATCLVGAASIRQQVGRAVDAAPLLAEAQLRVLRAHRANPDDLEAGRTLGLVLCQRASLAHVLDRHALAEHLICDAIALLERYHALLPDHVELRTELVEAHHERFRMTCDPDIERASARAVIDLLEPLRARGAMEEGLEDVWSQAQGFLRARVRKAVGMG